MASNPELSDFEKGVIVGYHRNGRSIRGIASELKYPKSTVAYVIRKWKVSGDCRNVTHETGCWRPKGAVQNYPEEPDTTDSPHPRGVQQASGTVVSVNIIRKEAHLLGYHGRAAAHKPLITKSNRAAQLSWYKAWRQWTVEQWKQVLWSDESRFTLFRSDGRTWVWRLPGERLLPDLLCQQ